MPNVKITDIEGLIKTNIRPRMETYFLVTEENLKSLNGKSILTDIFIFFASLFWGAFFSVLITIKATSGVAEVATQALLIYQKVFLCAGVCFTLFAFIFIYINYSGIRGIKKSTFTES